MINEKTPYLDLNLYRSILFLGLNLKSYNEIKNFIDKYSKKVNPAEHINIYRLSYAYLYYELSKYKKTLDNVAKIVINDFIFKYDIKNLMIKIYYDLEYWEIGRAHV